MDRLIGGGIEDFGSGTPFMAHGLEMDTVHDRVVWRLVVVETKVDEQSDQDHRLSEQAKDAAQHHAAVATLGQRWVAVQQVARYGRQDQDDLHHPCIGAPAHYGIVPEQQQHAGEQQ